MCGFKYCIYCQWHTCTEQQDGSSKFIIQNDITGMCNGLWGVLLDIANITISLYPEKSTVKSEIPGMDGSKVLTFLAIWQWLVWHKDSLWVFTSFENAKTDQANYSHKNSSWKFILRQLKDSICSLCICTCTFLNSSKSMKLSLSSSASVIVRCTMEFSYNRKSTMLHKKM